jgi:hypothetical protein
LAPLVMVKEVPVRWLLERSSFQTPLHGEMVWAVRVVAAQRSARYRIRFM